MEVRIQDKDAPGGADGQCNDLEVRKEVLLVLGAAGGWKGARKRVSGEGQGFERQAGTNPKGFARPTEELRLFWIGRGVY